MRILVINPFGGTEFYGKENLEKIKRSDTEFDIVNIGDVYPLKNNQFLYFRAKCTDGTLERVIKAEKEGYDAVFISCNLDIGLYEARSLVHIPVTATLESAALTAYVMGTRYSLITVDDQNGRIQEMLLNQYGLKGKLVSWRPIGIDANELYPEKTPADVIFRKTVEVSKQCLTQDKAEVVIAGCTLIGSLLTHRIDEALQMLGVPVLDGMITGFKMAEMMADMHKLAKIPPVSRLGYFRFPPQKDLETLRKFRHPTLPSVLSG